MRLVTSILIAVAFPSCVASSGGAGSGSGGGTAVTWSCERPKEGSYAFNVVSMSVVSASTPEMSKDCTELLGIVFKLGPNKPMLFFDSKAKDCGETWMPSSCTYSRKCGSVSAAGNSYGIFETYTVDANGVLAGELRMSFENTKPEFGAVGKCDMMTTLKDVKWSP